MNLHTKMDLTHYSLLSPLIPTKKPTQSLSFHHLVCFFLSNNTFPFKIDLLLRNNFGFV